MASGREALQVHLVPSEGLGQRVFSVSSNGVPVDGSSFTLPAGKKMSLDVLFQPGDKGYFTDTMLVYLQDNKRTPYATLDFCGWGVSPYLSFSDLVVRLPVTPLGVTSSAVLYVRAIG